MVSTRLKDSGSTAHPSEWPFDEYAYTHNDSNSSLLDIPKKRKAYLILETQAQEIAIGKKWKL